MAGDKGCLYWVGQQWSDPSKETAYLFHGAVHICTGSEGTRLEHKGEALSRSKDVSSWKAFEDWFICARVYQLLVLGMVIPPLLGNPYNRYINPYYWVDDHPPTIWKSWEFRRWHTCVAATSSKWSLAWNDYFRYQFLISLCSISEIWCFFAEKPSDQLLNQKLHCILHKFLRKFVQHLWKGFPSNLSVV